MSEPVADWAQLLIEAVEKPGIIADAYRLFWNYSSGNQLLAMFQCARRGVEPGPINTYQSWLDIGRHVKKGEKGLTLCMPVSVKVKPNDDEPNDEDKPKPATVTRFIFRPRWFVLSQTEGDEYSPPPIPEWKESVCLKQLNITRTTFNCMDGNVQGYATERTFAVSPIAFAPWRTTFHEIAHVVLGHTEESDPLIDDKKTERSIREVEAESVAMLCCASLDLPGIEHNRGYIQNWINGNEIPERSAARIFSAANRILQEGRLATHEAKPASARNMISR